MLLKQSTVQTLGEVMVVRAHDRPVLMSWTITRQCNLNCLHCYSPKLADTDTGLESLIIRRLKEAEVLAVTLTGGEPLLRPDLCGIVDQMTKQGISVHLNTNGLLLTRALASNLKSAGIQSVRVSLDGAEEITHEKIRRTKGSFLAAVNAIETLVACDIRATAATVPTKINVDQLEDIVALGRELGAESHHFFRLIATKGFMYEQLQLPVQVYFSRMTSICRAYGISWEEPLQSVFSLGSTIGCSAGVTYASVDNAGIVYPCPSLRVAVGSIVSHSLSEIWNGPELQRLRKRDFVRCKSCAYQQHCGGCRAAAWASCDDPYGSDPYCLHLDGQAT